MRCGSAVRTKIKSEKQQFEFLLDSLLKIPHTEIKAKLEAEKAAKRKKKERKAKRNDR